MRIAILAVLLCVFAHAQTVEATITGAGPTIVLIGGLNGDDASSQRVRAEAKKHHRFRLIAIPVANPARATLAFPPTGVAYRENPESHALWRYLAMQAPDLVLIDGQDPGLAAALGKSAALDLGPIPAERFNTFPKHIAESPAHAELDRRRARTPAQLAHDLAPYFGHNFNDPVYIQAIALIAQLRLGNLAEVQRLAEPYLDGSKNSFAHLTSPTLAGHLIFAELAARTHDPRDLALVKKVADLGFTPAGEMKESMPLHDEMSDSVFMACPILAAAGKLTGEQKYFDMAARHYRFMAHLDLRADGIYRHSPLTDAAWGRGNAFPALGLALTLANFPKDHPDYAALLEAFRAHLNALAKFQDADGLWHEIIDQPASYAEFTATAMIGTAMHMGVRQGWLDASFAPRAERAYRAIAARAGPHGNLLDVCESTGKQKSAADYLRRAALAGPDPRGGAMALLFATEMQ